MEADETERIARSRGLLPRYLTSELPGVGGATRVALEDFLVEELPLYGPSGSGQHTLFAIEKRGIATPEAIARLAAALRLPPRAFSSAGLKDARAIARQTLSVEGATPEQVRAVDVPDVRILWAERHRNRLKIGHLRGNRFTIRIRGVGPEAIEPATAILAVLQRRGVPNGFGYQRFGARWNSHLLGQAILRGDLGEFWHIYLGSPDAFDPPEGQEARQRFDAGDYAGALACWRARGSAEYRALGALAGGRGPQVAYDQVPHNLKELFLSAHQSFLYNRLLEVRLETLDRLENGDLAIKHDNGAFFRVEDADLEQPRADRLEISPSGPLYGYRGRLAEGRPGEREHALLSQEGLTLESWHLPGGLRVMGGRRPLRVPLGDVQVRYDGGLVLEFALPAGAYASNVVAEVTKGTGAAMPTDRVRR